MTFERAYYLGKYNPRRRDDLSKQCGEMLAEEAHLNKLNEEQQKVDARKSTFNRTEMLSVGLNERALFNNKNSTKHILRERTAQNVLFNMYKDALVLDESFVVAHEGQLRGGFIDKMKEILGTDKIYNGLQEKAKVSPAVKGLFEAVKAQADKKDAEINSSADMSNKNDIADSISLADDEDKKELHIKDGITSKDVSEFVKDKVTKTISDEKEADAENKSIIDSISQSKQLGENVVVRLSDKREQFSLFKSIMIHECNEIIALTKKTGESSDFATLDENGGIKVNMEMSLCEAVLEYTTLELCNTLKITDLSPYDVRQMSEHYAYC